MARRGRIGLLVTGLLPLLPAPGGAQSAVPSVGVARAERAPVVQQVAVTGSVVSPRASQVSPEVAGRVSDMRVEVGDRVEAGEVLAVLDREISRLDLRRAKAATREAREALADAERRLQEAERLSAGEAFAESALLSLRSEVRVDEATLARLEAEEARQRALLERHEVRAPFAGAISRKLSNAGEWVEPGTVLVELMSTSDLRIDFQVPQEFFPRVHAGDPVEVSLDTADARDLPGRIVSTVPQSDAGARTFLMLVVLEDPGVPIIPGLSARARLRLDSGREGVVVPRDALLRHPDGRVTVFVLGDGPGASGDGGSGDADATAAVSERRVVPGRSFDGRVEIVEGLEAGQRVVVIGNEGLQDGQRVRVQRSRPADV